jgi:hypothetical protein
LALTALKASAVMAMRIIWPSSGALDRNSMDLAHWML